MKRTVIPALIVAISILAGCSPNPPPEDTGETPAETTATTQDTGARPSNTDALGDPSPEPALPQAFQFLTRGLTIPMGASAAPIVEALGEPLNYFEAPSCAFDGIDRIYYYNGFELYTYPVGGEDFVLSVSLTDDSATTSEGVYLGMTYERMAEAYGEGYEQYLGQYTYNRAGSSLSFLIEDGKIALITYTYTDAPRLQ